ncbi:MAG: gliding motility-associated C-terminal domain-containing protein [Bacteroidota bacterium]
MTKQLVAIPILAAIIACIPGKHLLGQKIVLLTEDHNVFVVDLSVNPCKVEPGSSHFTGPAQSAQAIAMHRNSLFFMSSSVTEIVEHDLSFLHRSFGRTVSGEPNGGYTRVLTCNSTGTLFWVDELNQLVTTSDGFNSAKIVRGTIPFKATGDMVFYKDKLYLTAEGGVVEVDIEDPSRSKMVLPIPGREFPGLINVNVGCTGNKVYGVEAVGNTTQLVEFDLDQNKVMGVYCSFDLGSKIFDAASTNETGEAPYIALGSLFIKSSCLPETDKNEVRAEPYTHTGDSGFTYSFTKGQLVVGPFDLPRGKITSISQLESGIWNLNIKSSSGCSLDTLVVISQPGRVWTVVEASDDTCGARTAEAHIKVLLGNPPFNFEVEGQGPKATPYFPSLGAGVYKLKVSDDGHCSEEQTFTIKAYTPPMPIKEIKISPPKNCGAGGEIRVSYHLSANVSGIRLDDDSFQVSSLFIGVPAGPHRLQVKVGPCLFDTMVTMIATTGIPPVISFNHSGADCNGASSTVLVSGPASPFIISYNGGSFTSDTQFSNLAGGIYPVRVKDVNSCEWNVLDTILSYKPSIPVIDSVVTNNPCLGVGSFKLVISGAEKPYRFELAGNLYNSGVEVKNLPSGIYSVRMYTAAKCLAGTISFSIADKGNCDTIRAIFIPTAFTPNGDGKNDILKPMRNPVGKVAHFVFRVYNRNGQVLFETRTPGKGWDGRYQSIPQPTGVYVWVFEGTDAEGKLVVYSGTTVLIR